MDKIILSKFQIQELVSAGRYKIEEKIILGQEQLNILYKTSQSYGFEVNRKQLKKIFNSDKNKKQDKKQEYGVVIQIQGNYSIPSFYQINTELGRERVEFYIFHFTLSNRQNRLLAKQLIKMKTVKLFPGCDEEYLYEVLSETTDENFFETIKKLAPGLPIYNVNFKDDGAFTVEELGTI